MITYSVPLWFDNLAIVFITLFVVFLSITGAVFSLAGMRSWKKDKCIATSSFVAVFATLVMIHEMLKWLLSI